MSDVTKKPDPNKILQSLYAGPIVRANTNLPACWQVGDLKRVLADLPDDLPLDCEGIRPVWFNIGHDDGMGMLEHLGLMSDEDWGDEDEDEDED